MRRDVGDGKIIQRKAYGEKDISENTARRPQPQAAHTERKKLLIIMR